MTSGSDQILALRLIHRLVFCLILRRDLRRDLRRVLRLLFSLRPQFVVSASAVLDIWLVFSGPAGRPQPPLSSIGTWPASL